MADAIIKGRKHRANAQMACHVLEVIDCIMESGKKGAFVTVTSPCERPEKMN